MMIEKDDEEDRCMITKDVRGRTFDTVKAGCPICETICSYEVDDFGNVQNIDVCEHFVGPKEHDNKTAKFEKPAETVEVECPHCENTTVLEYDDDTGEVVDVPESCDHLNMEAGFDSGRVLFEEWESVKVDELRKKERA